MEIVMYHRSWCKKAVVALRPITPYRVFLSGPGGVGKSHVIRLIHSDTLKLLKLSRALQPDDVSVLLTASTSVAAFNIGGMMLHAALLLGHSEFGTYEPLNHDRLNTSRTRLSQLLLVWWVLICYLKNTNDSNESKVSHKKLCLVGSVY